MFFLVNILVIGFYLLALTIFNTTGIAMPLQLISIAWLLFVTPYNLTKILRLDLTGSIEKYFSWLIVFFFIFSPAYYIFHLIFGLGITANNILTINIFIAALTAIVILWQSKKIEISLPKINFQKIFNKHFLLIVALVLFGLTHYVNYSFYIFIPEADGYSDIRNIELFLDGESIEGGRKPAFYTAMTAISSFTTIPPYSLFSFWIIALQTTLILAVYLFIKRFDIKNIYLQGVLLLTTLSVPVINLEMDIVRPQTLYVLAFPIWVYFFYQAITKKHISYWIYTAVISVFGMLYHEFFFFLLAIFGALSFYQLFNRYYVKAENKQDKLIFGLSTALVISLVYSFSQEFRAVRFVLRFLDRTWNRISNTSSWEIWFLDSYTTDGAQMGWPGITGAAQYYGYYLSPALLLILISIIIFFPYLKNKIRAASFLYITIPLLTVYMFFAEGLPRLNNPYLPERFWLLITMTLVLVSIPLWKVIEEKYSSKIFKTVLISYTLILFIGIFGSFYVAQSKGAETSPAEYEAAQWIKENTPQNSLFITQGKNSRMIGYFAERSRMTPSEDYFLSDEIIEFIPQNQKESLLNELSLINENITEEFENLKNNNFYEIMLFHNYIASKVDTIEKIRINISELEKLGNPTMYVLYSEDKFNTIYAQREWWKKVNFYGANLEKFHETYPLVYSKNGVHIWIID